LSAGAERLSIQTFYRLSLWLPLLVPALVAVAVHGLGLPPLFPIPLLLASLLYGGLPYAAVAIAGTFWIGRRPEHEILRQANRTPLWMVAAYPPFCVLIGWRSGEIGMPVVLFMTGAVVIVGLGYTYVFLVYAMRAMLFGDFRPLRRFDQQP
jgi:hypothetical protein